MPGGRRMRIAMRGGSAGGRADAQQIGRTSLNDSRGTNGGEHGSGRGKQEQLALAPPPPLPLSLPTWAILVRLGGVCTWGRTS